MITRGSENPLAIAWERVCDGDWIRSRRCESEDWSHVLNAQADGEIVCQVLPHGQSRLGIRFRVGPNNLPTAVNEQIVDPAGLQCSIQPGSASA